MKWKLQACLLTHRRRLCLDESTGLRPVMISKRRIPNAKTSVFSSTIPLTKYSGAKYPNVPSIGIAAWWVHLLGSHFASPKSDICKKVQNLEWIQTVQQLWLNKRVGIRNEMGMGRVVNFVSRLSKVVLKLIRPPWTYQCQFWSGLMQVRVLSRW